MMRGLAAVAALALVAASATCVDRSPFRCNTDTQCGGLSQGKCTGGWCSLADSTCPTGRRYVELAGPASNSCVDEAAANCGNGHLDTGEGCDEGAANSDDPATVAACTSACQRRAPCGSLEGSQGARVDPTTGHCYVAWPDAVPWTQAQGACQQRGAQLAVIDSADEDAIVRAVAGQRERWIGMWAVPAAGASQELRWANGDMSSFRAFATGEPNNMGGVESCVSVDPASGWRDRPCGWPKSGGLPASPAQALSSVCETSCGNGVVEAGEECDPPGASCTATCKTKRACPRPELVSETNGHCYFLLDDGAAFSFADGKTRGAAAGAHIATINDDGELDAAARALATLPSPDGGVAPPATAWIGLKEEGNGVIAPRWDADTNEIFDSRRYHRFVDPDPDETIRPSKPACVAQTHTSSAEPDAWRDRPCLDVLPVICERE